jgi:hypothetical protein
MDDAIALINPPKSPLPDPTITQRALSIVQGLGKNLIYNPDNNRMFPQSPFYPENRPQFANGQMSPEDLQKVLPIIAGMSMPGVQEKNFTNVAKSIGQNSFTSPVPPVTLTKYPR